MKCPTCLGSHYIPFVRGDGSVSQYAQITCPNCGGYDHERDYADANIPDRRPDDFDFPCSATWRRYYNGDQQIEHLLEEASPVPAATLNDRRWDSVQQMRAQVLWLSKKVTEMRAEKKKTDYKQQVLGLNSQARAKRAESAKKQGIDI